MAHVLNIVYGGTTIQLNSGRYAILEYTPRAPESNVVTSESVLRDGGEQPAQAYKNVSEVAKIALLGDGSASNLASDKQAIEQALAQARRFQQYKIGNRVYVVFQPDGYATSYRSELLDGRVELSDVALGWQWHDRNIEIVIGWTRRFFWEGAETQIPLTNGNGTDNTSGLTIYNHDDGDAGNDNYVAMTAAAVTGDLPAPVRIEITNTYNNANRAYNYYISHNVLSNPSSLVHMLEAEAGSGGTTTGDATCSGGNRKDLSWAVTTEAELLSWTLSTSLLNACAGNYFRMFMRMGLSPTYTDCWLRLRIKFVLTTIWEGPQILLAANQRYTDLGVIQLPPWLPGSGDIYPLSLVLYGQRNQAGTHTIYSDVIQLSPLDGWRKLAPRGYGLEYNARIVDDGIENLLYTDGWGSSAKTGHYIGTGMPIAVWPNMAQRLYVLIDGSGSGSGEIARTSSLKCFYRPRRVTI